MADQAQAGAGHGPVPAIARLRARWPERWQMPQAGQERDRLPAACGKCLPGSEPREVWMVRRRSTVRFRKGTPQVRRVFVCLSEDLFRCREKVRRPARMQNPRSELVGRCLTDVDSASRAERSRLLPRARTRTGPGGQGDVRDHLVRSVGGGRGPRRSGCRRTSTGLRGGPWARTRGWSAPTRSPSRCSAATATMLCSSQAG
jgi:hypothetical protein